MFSNFSENGECCFVGSADGVSVIGWEPDREFDHIESAWSMLGDMKVVNKKLVCIKKVLFEIITLRRYHLMTK